MQGYIGQLPYSYLKVLNLIYKPYAAIIFLFSFLSAAVDAKDLDLLSFITLVTESSSDARNINDSMSIQGLNLDDARNVYDFQWRPSVELGVSDGSSRQGVGVGVTKKNEFGTTFTVSSQYEKIENDYTNTSIKTPSVGFTIEQGLFRNWGHSIGRLPLTRSEINTEKVYWSVISRKQALIRSSIQKYFNVLLSTKQLELKSLSVKRAKNNLEVTESRYGLGLVSKIDVYRTKIALLNSKDTKKNEARNLKRNIRVVDDLLPFSSEVHYNLSDKLDEFSFKLPAEYLSIALLARHDWQIFLLEEKLNDLDLLQAEKQLQPDIRLSLSAKKYLNEFDNISGESNNGIDWNVGLSYNSPLTLSKEKNALSRTLINNQSHQREKQELKRRIEYEINDAIDNLNLAIERGEIASELLLQSEKSVELAKIRFQRGLSNNQDLVQAENEFQSAKIDVLNQKIQVNLSKVLLAETLGILDIKWLENALRIN